MNDPTGYILPLWFSFLDFRFRAFYSCIFRSSDKPNSVDLVVSDRCFDTAYRSHLQESRRFAVFYIHGSVNRNSILIRSNKMQLYADIYLLQNYSTYFVCLPHPSSGVHKTVTAASGAGHITYQGNKLLPAWLGHAGRRLLPLYVIWPVPEAAVTVLCTPDDGCDDTRKM